MKTLVACPECSRHVRQTETRCPFCSADVGARIAAVAPRAMPVTRLGRAALFAFATASVGAAGCSSTEDDSGGNKGGSTDGGTEDGASGDDGGEGGDSNGSGGAKGEGGKGSGGRVSADGGSTSSGGTPSAGGRQNTGGEVAVPVYGAPFPIDGGAALPDAAPAKDGSPPSLDGGFVALYGAAPEYGAPPPFKP